MIRKNIGFQIKYSNFQISIPEKANTLLNNVQENYTGQWQDGGFWV